MSKKEMSARYASGKGRKGKKKSAYHKLVPSAVDNLIEAAPPAPQSLRPAPAPLAAPRKPVQRSWMPPKAGRGQPGLITDYSYVTNDLKRIAVTAGAMFLILGVLSFVIK